MASLPQPDFTPLPEALHNNILFTLIAFAILIWDSISTLPSERRVVWKVCRRRVTSESSDEGAHPQNAGKMVFDKDRVSHQVRRRALCGDPATHASAGSRYWTMAATAGSLGLFFSDSISPSTSSASTSWLLLELFHSRPMRKNRALHSEQ